MASVSQHYARRTASGVRADAGTRNELAAPVVLMVSGGADSTALLLMACTAALDIQDGRGPARIARERLHVLHVNHHLRGAASDADEAFVRALCERQGLPLCVEHASFADMGGQNLEGAAREVRYAAARRYVRDLSRAAGTRGSAARILTAHTASDRAETFFMNAIKGSGPAGLSSIPRRRNIIVRPLLDYTHEELVRYLEVIGQAWREDESNADTSYLRNFVRHRLVPVASERNAHLARSIGAACDILGDEDAFMAQLAGRSLRSCTRDERPGCLVLDAARLAAAEVAIARRVVRMAVLRLVPEARLEMRHVEAVLACVAAGAGSLTLPLGLDVRMEFGVLTLRTRAAREELSCGWLTVPGSMALANQAVLAAEILAIPRSADPVRAARDAADGADGVRVQTVLVDALALGYGEGEVRAAMMDEQRDARRLAAPVRLRVSAPAAGDTLCPIGMQGRRKKLSDLLGEARIPVAERPCVPVVRTAPAGEIVWVAGVRLDERFKCTPATRFALKLTMTSVG